MPNRDDKCRIPLSQIPPSDLELNSLWEDLKKRLPSEIESFTARYNAPACFPRRVSLERVQKAVACGSSASRLGLVFADEKQQQEFVDDFRDRMGSGNFKDVELSLVATGSAFTGFSINPVSYKEYGYMRFCGDNGKTDLDLQIYCKPMRDQALDEGLPLFPNHFLKDGDHARLTTFDNIFADRVAPYDCEPWILNFQNEWSKRLRENFFGTGILFEGVHIALMAEETFQTDGGLGSSYEMLKVD